MPITISSTQGLQCAGAMKGGDSRLRKMPSYLQEEKRLKALKEYDILNTAPESSYDSISLLAAQVCNTPVAFVAISDKNRQWFKAKFGTSLKEIPHNLSFYTRARADAGQVLIVKDTLRDERFAHHPLVNEDPFIRFYAGAPILNKKGHILGVVAVVDHQPGDLDQGQVRALKALAGQVSYLLEWRKEHNRIKRLAEELKETNEELHQFGHAISHDLKQPLYSIQGLLRLMQDTLAGEGQEENLELVSMALKSSDNLHTLLEDLLEYLQSGRVRSKKKPVSLNRIFLRVKNSLREQINNSNAQVFATRVLPGLSGYGTDLQRLFQNLISNAIKFTEPGVQPKIVLNCNEQKSHWLITVSDNGIGIEKRHANKVFDMLTRLHSESKYEGTGMGLAICKKIVENHQGKIWLKSKPGKGSTFYIKLPKT